MKNSVVKLLITGYTLLFTTIMYSQSYDKTPISILDIKKRMVNFEYLRPVDTLRNQMDQYVQIYCKINNIYGKIYSPVITLDEKLLL